MPSLLDRTKGYAAFAVRRALGRSPDARVEALETRVRELERMLAYQLRLPQGHTVNAFDQVVRLDHKGRTHWRSADGKVILTPIEGMPYGVDLSVDESALDLPEPPDPGCADALLGIVDCDATEADVEGCGNRLEFHAGDYISGQVEAADDPGNVAIRLDWCAPVGFPPGILGDWNAPGPPSIWATITVGDACAGGCTEYVVPLWTPG